MRLVIFGVSNLLGTILDCALARGLTPSHVVTNMPQVTRQRTKSIADVLAHIPNPPQVIPLDRFSVGDGEHYFLGTTSPNRRELVEEISSRFGITCCTLVHPAAHVSPRARLASGVFIGAGSVVGPGAELREHAYVGQKVSVGHDVVVGAYARLQHGCNVGGYVYVGRAATVGPGVTIAHELVIGEGAVLAAGSVIIKDVPDGVLVAGVPGVVKKALC